jgi:NAD+ synthase
MAEATVGYFTKWGDGAYDLNPLAMVTKQEVYTLAKYLGVPESIQYKSPSAGLWEGQTDEDELGMTYAQIDGFILKGTSGNPVIDELIRKRIQQSAHKFAAVPTFKG